MYYFTQWKGNVVSVKCISSLRSVGIAKPLLLVLKLCFPLDLWSLQGLGRSLCDYCLHTDLYLTFNYLRGSAAWRCQYIPSFGTRRGERKPSLVSTPTILSLSVAQDLNRDPLCSWQHPSPPQSSTDGCLWHSYSMWVLKGGFMEIWSCCPLDM